MQNSKLKGLVAGFFSLLFFFILLAGGTGLIFSPDKVSTWIKKGLNSADIKGLEVEFERAKTTWTGSFRHPFGVKITGVELKLKKNECKTQKVNFKSLIIPFSITQALNKKVELGVLKAYGGSLSSDVTCVKSVLDKEKDSSKEKSKKNLELENRIENKILDFVLNLQEIKALEQRESFSLRGVLISDFEVFSSEHKGNEHSLYIDRIKVGVISLDTFEGELQGAYAVKELETQKKHNIKLKGDFNIDNGSASFKIDGRKKEGIFALEFKAPFWKSSDKKPFAKITFKDFPVSSVVDIFGLDLKFSKEKKRASWLNCNLTSSFKSESISLKSSSCFIKGNLGNYNITSGLDLDWEDKKRWVLNKAIDVKISNVFLGDIYPVFGRRGPNGIFGEFGKLNIDLSVVSFDSAYAEFELRDFTILFRSKGVSSFQRGKSARGTGAIVSKDKFEFSIEEMDLENGEFEGSINGVFDLTKSEFELNFEIPHILLNPKIGKKLFQTEIGFFELNGEGRFNYKDSLQDVKIVFGFDEIKSKNWGLNKVKMPCVILNKTMDCRYSLTSLSLSQEVLNSLNLEDEAVFSNLKGSLNYYKRKLLIEARKENEKNNLLKASWTQDVGLEGEILLNDGSLKKLNFRDFK